MILHINRIECCAASLLDGLLVIQSASSAIPPNLIPWREIPIAVLATLEVTEEVDSGVRLFQSKLTATLCGQRAALPDGPLAFRLTSVSGYTYLLGTHRHPYPLTAQEVRLPSSPAEPSIVTLTVSLSDEFGLLRIV